MLGVHCLATRSYNEIASELLLDAVSSKAVMLEKYQVGLGEAGPCFERIALLIFVGKRTSAYSVDRMGKFNDQNEWIMKANRQHCDSE